MVARLIINSEEGDGKDDIVVNKSGSLSCGVEQPDNENKFDSKEERNTRESEKRVRLRMLV